MNNKKAVFSTLFCIFIAALFILGCNNHLLKPQQDEPHLLVKIANSTGARNATTTGEWQISAWIENRDGTKSHQQNVTSASGSEASIPFDDLVIGSQIKIHLEVTKINDTQTKFTGESGWTTIKEGVNVIVIVLREDNGAQVPVIEGINSTIKTYTSNPQPVTTTLKAVASVTDGGALTYQWYSSDSPTTDSGTAIEGATSATYDARVEAGKTKYFYCIVTNTNNKVNGTKTASATSNIATVASIVGQLDSITAQYIGNHELVNSEINYSNIEIVQVYTIPDAEPQEISVVASSVKDQYTIVLQEPTNAIGNVPATVTHNTNPQITADFTIPVKYQLDVNKLTLNGSNSVEQNGSLSLTATYADTYTKYDGESSNTYNVKDNLTITWTGATAQSTSWLANADTTSTGSKTATIKLTPKDEWCDTPNGIEKSHSYEVTVIPLDGYFVSADGSDSNAGTYNAPYKTLANAINQARTDNKTIYIMGELTATSENSSDSATVFFVENEVGSTENPIIIEGYGTGATLNATGSNKRVFETNATSYIIMRNLTITGGNISSGSGGGIYYYQGELTLENCTVTNNSTSDAAHDGIYMYGSNNYLTMENTKVENDSVYLYSTGKADLGTGCVFGDITADASSITLSEDVTINGILNYKTNGGGITIATTLSSTIPIKLNVVNPNSSSTILRVSAGLDINNEYTKFTLQNTDYTWHIYNGVGYLQAASN